MQGSQLFDYWHDLDESVEPGWAPFTATGLAQWEPPVFTDFLGISPRSARSETLSLLGALRHDTSARRRPGAVSRPVADGIETPALLGGRPSVQPAVAVVEVSGHSAAS